MEEQLITIKDLEAKTEEFFQLHWNPEKHGDQPEWKSWKFKGPIRNNNKRGCYALVNDKYIEYIGVGAGKSVERYEGSGLGDRLKKYHQLNKIENKRKKTILAEERTYMPRAEYREWLTEILTIGFPGPPDNVGTRDAGYLAASLEVFLIKELKPKRNRQMKQ